MSDSVEQRNEPAYKLRTENMEHRWFWIEYWDNLSRRWKRSTYTRNEPISADEANQILAVSDFHCWTTYRTVLAETTPHSCQ